MKNFFSFLVLLFAFVTLAMADTVSFEATVSQSKIALNEVLQLTLTVSGSKDDVQPISLPAIEGFSAKYFGPSTSVSIINGNYHSEHSFVYNLFPNKIGHFEIPPITTTIAGQTYTSKPIDIDVLENKTTDTSGQVQAQPQESLKDKILVKVELGQKRVYLNESVPLSIKLLVNNVPIRDIEYPQFEKNGFVIDDFAKPEQYSQVFNGIKYDVVEFKTSLHPTHLGDITVGPIQVAGNILYKTGNNNALNQDSFFGSDVFNNFFDSYTTRPIIVASGTYSIHVSALPEANRPQDFSGAVGQFDFQASVSPSHVKVGDPLTLKMYLKGSGNLKGLKIPVFKAEGFKTYDLNVKNVADGKKAEEVIIPTTTTIEKVPALHFSYFDPRIGDYKTLIQGPFPIQVSAPSPEQEFKAVGFSDISQQKPAPTAPSFSVWQTLLHLNRGVKKLLTSFRFWLGFSLVLIGGGAYILWQRYLEKLETDPAFARRMRAFREAKQGLSRAQLHMAQGKPKEFYAFLSKMLRDYLANKWHLSASTLNTEMITQRLKRAHIDEARIRQLTALLEQSDLICFAGEAADSAQMQKDYTLAQDLIHYFKGSLRVS